VTQVLECLRKYGERLDSEIAAETGMPVVAVRRHVASLAAEGAVIKCDLIRFEDGKRIEAWQCRVAGYIPPAAPGRKSKAKT
jgi:DNA-binding IclR family transcriptional regulator